MKKYLILLISLLNVNCASLGLFQCTGVIGAGYISNKDNIVDFIYTGSPADKLGIQVDDYLLNPQDLHGVPGTLVLVRWKHKTEIHEMTTATVCLNELRIWK